MVHELLFLSGRTIRCVRWINCRSLYRFLFKAIWARLRIHPDVHRLLRDSSPMGICDLMTFLPLHHLLMDLNLNGLIITRVRIMLEKHLLVHLILYCTWEHLGLSPKSDHSHASVHILLVVDYLLVHRFLSGHTDLWVVATALRTWLKGQRGLVLAVGQNILQRPSSWRLELSLLLISIDQVRCVSSH